MTNKNILIGIVLLLAVGVVGYFFFPQTFSQKVENEQLDSSPYTVTLSGTYTCLPHMDTKGPQTMECAFGLKTNDGEYYAVNFGQPGDNMSQFQSGEHIKAEGFVVIKEALSSDHWAKYNMKGVFTITRMIEPSTTVSGKIDINMVCQNALAYMSFPDAASADLFIKECREGKHPEVIEQYKASLNLDGAAI